MISAKDTKDVVRSYSQYLTHNKDLLAILDGDLLPYVDKALQCQLSPQSYSQAKHRVMPINIFPKVIDKLTNIYQTKVLREVEGGTDLDAELVSWYEQELRLNAKMNSANELFNACRGTLLYPYVYDGKPYLRAIDNDKFIVLAQNPALPSTPTDVIILAGKKNDKDVYWVFDDYSFAVYVDDELDRMEMRRLGNQEGINPFGRLPFVWVNSSDRRIMPIQDSSVMSVLVTLPVMLSDLNLAAMFQTFSMLYTIDADDKDIKFAPNAILSFKSDLASETKPEIGQIKPQVDIDQVIGLVQSELSMWLGTKGIRPGTVGQLNAENVSSGIAKVIDEMDTFEAREKQTTVFKHAEAEFWDLLLNYMHPYWVATGQIENRQLFTSSARVVTNFSVQLPAQRRGELVADLKAEVEAGFNTRENAIKMLNPELSEEEVNELIDEINGVEDDGAPRPEGDAARAEDPGNLDGETAQGPRGLSY